MQGNKSLINFPKVNWTTATNLINENLKEFNIVYTKYLLRLTYLVNDQGKDIENFEESLKKILEFNI